MRQALREAQKAYDADEVPVGAIVVMNNRIIARGYNQTEMLNDATAHAEMIALTAAFGHLSSKYLVGATLYVTLEPCTMCCGALYWSKIAKVVYGADDPKHGGLSLNGNILHPKTELVTGILANESREMIREFFAGKRR